MKAILRREMEALVSDWQGGVVFFAIPLAFTLSLLRMAFIASVVDFAQCATDALLAFFVVAPLYAAFGFSADRRCGTDRLLRSLPVKAWQLVFARFLVYSVPVIAGVLLSTVVLCLFCLFTGYAASIALSSVLLYLLCGLVFVALGLLLSCLSLNPFVNALAAALLVAICVFAPQIASYSLPSGLMTGCILALVGLASFAVASTSTRNSSVSLLVACACIAIAVFTVLRIQGFAADTWRMLLQTLSLPERFASLRVGVFHPLSACMLIPVLCSALIATACVWKIECHEVRRMQR